MDDDIGWGSDLREAAVNLVSGREGPAARGRRSNKENVGSSSNNNCVSRRLDMDATTKHLPRSAGIGAFRQAHVESGVAVAPPRPPPPPPCPSHPSEAAACTGGDFSLLLQRNRELEEDVVRLTKALSENRDTSEQISSRLQAAIGREEAAREERDACRRREREGANLLQKKLVVIQSSEAKAKEALAALKHEQEAKRAAQRESEAAKARLRAAKVKVGTDSAELADTTKKVNTLEERVASLNAAVAMKNRKIKTLERENEAQQQSNRTKSETIERHTSSSAELERKLDASARELTNSRVREVAALKDSEHLRERIAEFQKEILLQRERSVEATSRVLSTSEKLNASLATEKDLAERIKSRDEEVAVAREASAHLQERLSAERRRAEDAEFDQCRLNNEIETLESRIQESRNDLDASRATVEELEERHRKTAEELANALSTRESDRVTAQEAIVELKGRVAKQEAEISELNAKNLSLQSLLQEHKVKEAAATDKLSTCLEELEAKSTLLDAEKARHEVTEKEKLEVEKRMEMMQDHHQSVTIPELQEQTRALQSEIGVLTNSIHEKDIALESMEREIQRLGEENVSVKTEYDKACVSRRQELEQLAIVEDEVSLLRTEKDNIYREFLQITNKREEAKAALESESDSKRELSSSLSILREKLQEQQQLLEQSHRMMSTMKTNESELLQHVQEKEAQLVQSACHIERLVTRLAATEKEVAEAKGRGEEAKRNIQSMKEKVRQLENASGCRLDNPPPPTKEEGERISELEQALEKANRQRKDSEASASNAIKVEAKRRGEIAELRVRAEAAEARLQEVTSAHSAANLRYTAHVNGLKSKLEVAAKEADTLRDAVSESKRSSKAHAHRVKALEHERKDTDDARAREASAIAMDMQELSQLERQYLESIKEEVEDVRQDFVHLQALADGEIAELHDAGRDGLQSLLDSVIAMRGSIPNIRQEMNAHLGKCVGEADFQAVQSELHDAVKALEEEREGRRKAQSANAESQERIKEMNAEIDRLSHVIKSKENDLHCLEERQQRHLEEIRSKAEASQRSELASSMQEISSCFSQVMNGVESSTRAISDKITSISLKSATLQCSIDNRAKKVGAHIHEKDACIRQLSSEVRRVLMAALSQRNGFQSSSLYKDKSLLEAALRIAKETATSTATLSKERKEVSSSSAFTFVERHGAWPTSLTPLVRRYIKRCEAEKQEPFPTAARATQGANSHSGKQNILWMEGQLLQLIREREIFRTGFEHQTQCRESATNLHQHAAETNKGLRKSTPPLQKRRPSPMRTSPVGPATPQPQSYDGRESLDVVAIQDIISTLDE